jgi:addiction module RelB/DinJ family antitoxin/mutator protein MutT
MTDARLSVRVDSDTKSQAENVFRSLGLNLSTGINLFLARVARQRAIPFSLTLDRNEILGSESVENELSAMKREGIPAARFDEKRAYPYLEYPDGARKYSLEQIKDIVKEHRPGPIGKYRYYSVLIPLVEIEGKIHVLFEIRSSNLKVQPGEVSFPGGKIEDGETPAQAAVRETAEEIGIKISDVELFGPLNYIVTYSSFTMYGFAGHIDSDVLKQTTPNPGEVAETFTIPLSFFMENEPEVFNHVVRPDISEEFTVAPNYPWRTGMATTPVYTYDAGPKKRVVWGLTARMTWDFVSLIKK